MASLLWPDNFAGGVVAECRAVNAVMHVQAADTMRPERGTLWRTMLLGCSTRPTLTVSEAMGQLTSKAPASSFDQLPLNCNPVLIPSAIPPQPRPPPPPPSTPVSLEALLFSQDAQTTLIYTFIHRLGTADHELCDIATAFLAVADSHIPLPIHLTWCVLWIMYACPDVFCGLATPPSLILGWTRGNFRQRMELQLSGEFVHTGKKRSQSRVSKPALSPLEMVDSAWADYIFEATKLPGTVALENGWTHAGRGAHQPL